MAPRNPRSAAYHGATLLMCLLSLGGVSAENRAKGADVFTVHTGFPGASARVLHVDPIQGIVRITPAGDPQRGWPNWWALRINGLSEGETLTVEVVPSDAPSRRQSRDTDRPLEAKWALPHRASISYDGVTWQHTRLGEGGGETRRYSLEAQGPSLWIAWGPMFLPSDTQALIDHAKAAQPEVLAFVLAQTREGRAVRGLRLGGSDAAGPVVWIQARQHAWEAGSSWVARGFVEWLASDKPEAAWLREHAEIYVIPIMDVDNVATGNGGKDADPHDHNRDWNAEPVYPEVAAAQAMLRGFGEASRLAVFLDLHNPGPSNPNSFFYAATPETLPESARAAQQRFLDLAERHMIGPLNLAKEPKWVDGDYTDRGRGLRTSASWVREHGRPDTVSLTFEAAWNHPRSDAESYLKLGAQLGQTLQAFLGSGE